MNCLDLRKSFEKRESLDDSSVAHLEVCEDCQSHVFEEESLSRLIRSLPQKDSPLDFNRAVMSRITAENEPRSWGWAALRIALPTGAMVLVIGAVVLNSNLFSPSGATEDSRLEIVGAPKEQPVFKIEETLEGSRDSASTANAGRDSTATSSPEAGPALIAGKPERDGDQPSREPRNNAIDKKKRTDIRSLDRGTEEPDVLSPPGLDPDRTIDTNGQIQEKNFSAVEILSALGVSTDWNENRLFVVSVTRRGIGERSGIKSGDLVLAIDGVAISRLPRVGGVVSGRTITVSRSGKRIIITVGMQD